MLARLKDRSKGSVDVVQSKSQDDLLRMTRLSAEGELK